MSGRAEIWRRRLDALADAWGRPRATADALDAAVAELVDLTSRQEVWTVLYALGASMPSDETVLDVVRRTVLEGPSALRAELRRTATRRALRREVRFEADATLVDVGHTARAEFRTGIQRVAVETAVRWHREHGCVLVGWTHPRDALRALDEGEVADLVAGRPGPGELWRPRADVDEAVLVPLGGTYLAPELTWSKVGLISLARHSGLRTGVIGFDCVCLTTAETVAEGMPAEFARYLAGVRHVDRVVAISRGAAVEFAGWAGMLAGTGLPGPQISEVLLPDEMSVTPDAAQAEALFAVGRLPRVLVVGSHEPRKNHLAVLAAAETLWNEGLEFTLSFVGGRSWGNHHFHTTLDRLQALGRPVATVSGVSDAALAAAYASARFTMFPSLNEGFGLPVAESLAHGTPVITSNYGSMKEIAEGGGALLVDPRDDDDVTDAMRRLLVDDDLLERLRAEARARPVRTWDTYAEETWAAFTGAGA